MNWVGYLLCLATFIYSIACFFLDFRVALTPYNAVVLGVSAALLAWMKFGEWAMTDKRQFYGRVTETYVFMVGQWWLSLALFWAGLAGYCQIRRAQGYLDDHWYLLQTQVLIPFTTQLDCKQNYELRATHLMILCIVTSLLCLPMALDAWRALGGALQLVRARFAVMVAEFVPLLVFSVATATYAVYAAEVSTFATPDTTADLLWISAMAGLSVIAVALSAAALAAWGSCFASHAVLALLLPLPAIVMFSTSLWVQSREREVVAFVSANWDTLRLYVPPAYSALSWKNYAYASTTPMLQAASLGLQLSMLCIISALYHLWAAAAMHSVGQDLASAAEAHASTHARLLAVALGEAPGVGEGASGQEGPQASGLAEAPLSPGGRGKRMPSYGTNGPYSALAASSEEAGGGGGEAGSQGAGPAPEGASAELFISVDVTSSAAQKLRAAAGSRALAGASPEDKALHARLDAVDGLRALPASFALELQGLLSRVTLPPARNSAELLRHDLVQLWGSGRTCFFCALGIAFAALMGLTGALVKATTDGYCSRLVARAYGAKTLNYTTSVPLWQGGGANWADPSTSGDYYPGYFPSFPPFSKSNPTSGAPTVVTVTHGYPLGSVEVLAAGGTVGDVGRKPFSPTNITVEAIFFAVDGRDLPSAASVAASLITYGAFIPGPCGGFDPASADCGGYSHVAITLAPPAKAEDKCLGVRLRITMPATFFIQLNVTATSAAVNVTGNGGTFLQSYLFPSFYSVKAVTDTAPITLYNVYADSRIQDATPTYYYNSLNTPPLNYIANASFEPSVFGKSRAGLLTYQGMLSAGVYGASGGGVRFASVASACLYGGYTTPPLTPAAAIGELALCGSIVGAAEGSSSLGVSNLLAAVSASFSTVSGMLVCANVAALIGGALDFSSYSGNVYLTNLVHGAGNETSVTTRGNVAASATFVNRLNVTTLDAGSVSFVALFVGINSSAELKFPLGPGFSLAFNPLTALFNPHQQSYSVPAVAVRTDFGDVSALSIGSNPTAPFADVLSVDFRSNDGAIKLEVNGGGINADYVVSSGAASALVEIDGNSAPLRGHLGSVGSGNNSVYLRSERDNVQLSCACSGAPLAAPSRGACFLTLFSLHPHPHLACSASLAVVNLGRFLLCFSLLLCFAFAPAARL